MSRWRLLLFAAIPLVAAGMGLVVLATEEPWKSAGMPVFVAGAVLYITARVGELIAGRRR